MLRYTNILSRHQTLPKNPIYAIIRNFHKDPVPVSWERPRLGWTKLNYDGSCMGRGSRASIGGVFRNHNAEFLLGYAESIGKSTSCIAELAALQRGLELARQHNLNNVWLEGDAKAMVEIVVKRRHVKCSKMRKLVIDINDIVAELDSCMFSHVYREGNRAADEFAQIGHRCREPQVWVCEPPIDVLKIVNEDAEGKIILRRR